MTNSGENPPERDFYLNTENAEVHLLEPNMALKGKKPCLGVFLGGDEDICKERGGAQALATSSNSTWSGQVPFQVWSFSEEF